MGRRRRRAVQLQKKDNKLDIAFDCPYCNTARSVEVKMKRPVELAELKCRACGVGYSCRINYLMEPVDVYAEWVDEAAEKKIKSERDAAKAAAAFRGNMIGGVGMGGVGIGGVGVTAGGRRGSGAAAGSSSAASTAGGRGRSASAGATADARRERSRSRSPAAEKRRSRSRRRENEGNDVEVGDKDRRKRSRAEQQEEADLFGEVEEN